MHNQFNGAKVSELTGVPGWETILEQETLAAYASNMPDNGIIVEIGAEFGMSASLFCWFAPHTAKIYSIDLFPGDLLQVHTDNLKRAGFAGRSKQIQGDSAQIGFGWQLGKIDLLFIDGDHSYNGVQRDIAAWIPHVKVNGVVIFHDAAPRTNPNPHYLHLEVQRAIDEWRNKDWTEQPPKDTMRIFIRER